MKSSYFDRYVRSHRPLLMLTSVDTHAYFGRSKTTSLKNFRIARTKFDEVRDYLYPIPINERSLNNNLTQNPGWVDGLSF